MAPFRGRCNMNRLPLITFILFIIATLIVVTCQAMGISEYNARYETLHLLNTKISGMPPVSQSSIDIAMKLYAIKRPPSCKHPVLGKILELGEISGHPLSSTRIITMGKNAFTSWGMLGSVLSHEIEVHCNQTFILASILDAIDEKYEEFNKTYKPPSSPMLVLVPKVYYGLWLMEQEAYSYQIKYAARFGLTEKEVNSIRYTRDYLYPPR
jgi:hypothetical protein